MTEQEKIREGIYELLKEYGLYNWDVRNRVSMAIMEYLHERGVVIKGRMLTFEGEPVGFEVEPLIEEVKND